MKRGQPLSRPTLITEKASRTEGSDRPADIISHQEPHDSESEAAILAALLSQQDKCIDGPMKKWTSAQTFQFALVSCGLFWLVIVVLAWAYMHGH